MPFVRCKFHTESGGCRRQGMGCAFIHPGEPGWYNAPPPSSKVRDRSGDWERVKPQVKRGAAPSARDTGGSARISATDTGSGWDTGGGWGTGGGWDTGGGWGTGGSASTLIQASEPAQPVNPFATKSKDTSTHAVPTASGDTKSSEDGWGGSAQNDKWGAGWGDNKDGGSTWGSPRSDWGTGWGDNKDANSRKVSDSMIVHNQVEKTKQNKEKGKAVLAPPRIRIPGNEDKKAKITGTNNEPLGTGKWGESRSSTLPTTSTPITTSTPVSVKTPSDPIRVKRKREVAFDDSSDVLKEYVKTWERGVRARFSLVEAEAKRDRWFRTQKSPCYARIGEAGRKRLDGQRAECDKEVNSQREKLSCAVASLVDFHDAFSSNLDLGQRYNVCQDVEKFIRESKAFVAETRAIVEHVFKSKNDVQLGHIEKHPSIADAASIDSLRNQVRGLEERFEQAQTELTLRRHRDVRLEIEELLTAKIGDLRLARQHEIDRVASQPRPEVVIPLGALERIEETAQQVRELDAKVPHTVEDIRALLLRVDATTKRVSELEEELLMNKKTYKKMQETAAGNEETERRVDERLEKIRGQYERLVASQPCGPAGQSAMSPPTNFNSPDKLMESLRPAFEAMLDKFYEREVRPTIASLQQAVIAASDRHQEQAIKVLWGRIQPAMNMVAGVSRWLDSQELELTAPVGDD